MYVMSYFGALILFSLVINNCDLQALQCWSICYNCANLTAPLTTCTCKLACTDNVRVVLYLTASVLMDECMDSMSAYASFRLPTVILQFQKSIQFQLPFYVLLVLLSFYCISILENFFV